MKKTTLKYLARKRRHKRVRRKVRGTPLRPRLSVFRSNKHIYAQIIDDTQGTVLAAASSLSKELREQLKEGTKKTVQGRLVGLFLSKLALDRNVKAVVFDRGGYKHAGRLKALAEGAREGGLDF